MEQDTLAWSLSATGRMYSAPGLGSKGERAVLPREERGTVPDGDSLRRMIMMSEREPIAIAGADYLEGMGIYNVIMECLKEFPKERQQRKFPIMLGLTQAMVTWIHETFPEADWPERTEEVCSYLREYSSAFSFFAHQKLKKNGVGQRKRAAKTVIK